MTAVELRMPLGYVEMDAEEMEYMDGGGFCNEYSIKQSKAFLNKVYCWTYASALKQWLYLDNISTFDLAAEIYGHAKVWYCNLVQIGNLIGFGLAKDLHDRSKVIDVKNGLDSRYWAFRMIYTYL